MSYSPDKDIRFSPSKWCFKCNVPVFFTSKEALTPRGKPTKDVFTGKAIPLDPSTGEHHVCKPEDISAYRETDKYKRTVAEWKSRQQQKEENFGSTDTSYNTTNKNNDDSLGKILNSISHTNAVLEQMQIDYKADMAAIKYALKIDSDSSSSSGETQT